MTYRTVANQTTARRGGRADGDAALGQRTVVSVTLENQVDMVARLEDNPEFIGGATTAPTVYKGRSYRPEGTDQYEAS